ncbi:MAG TPA: CAP domain-containing protein [Spirochaetota bacterium]|nr:CAP domain-containing protein [Spirochaetota bacterium]
MNARFRHGLLCLLAVMALFTVGAPNALSYTDADLRQAVSENEREKRLSEYKDNETTLRLKLEVLDLINENRSRHGLSALKLDILACRVASKTASEASQGDYYGHWNLRGEKPYQRYAFAGGVDHVMENASMIQGGGPMTKDYAQVLSFIKKMHMAMYNETPPNDGHRKNILLPLHTHAGLGFSMIENRFRYYELYVDRYLEFDAVPASVKAGQKVSVSGRVAVPGYGVFFATVYYEPIPGPMTPSELRGMGSYPDFTNTRVANLPYWRIEYDDASGKFAFSFPAARSGLYYVHIYIKKGHTGKEPPSSVSTAGLSPVSGLVIRAD